MKNPKNIKPLTKTITTAAESNYTQLTASKTPFYEAHNAERYMRQQIIKDIRQITGSPLICYVGGNGTAIDRDDVLPFADLLSRLTPGENLSLLLHTAGGDIDAAEKLISMVRAIVGGGHLAVVIPDYAKSAGTLMSLGANEIVMSDSSEIGPIDPQIDLHDINGNIVNQSVQHYLDAFQTHSKALTKNPDDPVAKTMLAKLDPSTVKCFEALFARAREVAQEQLLKGGMQTGRPFTAIAGDLLDTTRWQKHGQMIDADDAKQLGLGVRYLSPQSAEWRAYWKLYCLQRLAINDGQKLFESDYVFLKMEGN